MHPILASKARLVAYLALWLLLGAALGALLAQATALGRGEALALALPLAILYAFVCLATFYLCRVLPLESQGLGALAATHVAAATVSSLSWVAVALGISRLLDQALPGIANRFAGGLVVLFSVGMLLTLLATATHYVWLAFEQSRDAETRGLALKVLARETELKALRAQIDPHFLFNSLNSISALTTSDPQGARRMTVLLGDFLRSSLAVGSKDRIPLVQEMALVEHFLSIEHVRFGARLVSDLSLDPSAAGCLVPPLLLQPLVENAVRHGIAGLVEGGTIRVAASQHDGRVRVVVENPRDPDRPVVRGVGVGLTNVRTRLTTAFGADARVDVRDTGRAFRVELSLPAVPAPPEAAPALGPARLAGDRR